MKKIITAKEQFENDAKNAKYADEVCEYDYYYEEEDKNAVNAVFDTVGDCLSYLAEEGYLCGGDSIKFIGDDEDSEKMSEWKPTTSAKTSFLPMPFATNPTAPPVARWSGTNIH